MIFNMKTIIIYFIFSSDTEAEAYTSKLVFMCGCNTDAEDLLSGVLCPKHEDMISCRFKDLTGDLPWCYARIKGQRPKT